MNRLAFKFATLSMLLFCAFRVAAQPDANKLAEKYSCSSQNKNAVLNYFTNYQAQQKRRAEVESKTRENQIAQFGKTLPLISPRCEWGGGGCPVSLVKPYYPIQAIQFRLFGEVKVEAIVNEKGTVIFAQSFGNKPFLAQVARVAACRSRFTPLIYDDEAVKFKRKIVYNFLQ